METHIISRREALRRVGFLMGGALSAPTVAGILGGCRTGAEAERQAAVLSGRYGDLSAAVSERIIPETDTPGAGNADVQQFIDRMLSEWYPDDLRRRFIEGLDDLDARAQAAAGTSFLEADADRQHEILAALDQQTFAAADPAPNTGSLRERVEGGTELEETLDLTPETRGKLQRSLDEAAARTAARRPDGGPFVRADAANEGSLIGDPSFWRIMKELTLLGYYWSEAGATQELKYDPVPGKWEACVPFEDIGKTWAT